ncbi:NADH-quinone oxidoreductase subunit C [Kitasatospora sp. NPDC059795]|uniref:NADH-quinone oxidoreductase subunit C n=1 Tax=Kitasatospora sp. NPDC059795 TaxID=3346949 RepID=UPI003657FCF8
MTETPDVPPAGPSAVPSAAERAAAAIGPWATAVEAYDLLTVTVPAEHWIEALTAARDGLGLAFLDWLSAVDELAEGFAVCAHLAAVGEPGRVRRLLLRTRVPRDKAVLPTAVGVYAGAAWHERETREMFGIEFPGHPFPATLLLPDGFEGHPLRKDFVLAARVAKDWPGAKEPGESDHGGGPARRKMLPPGVPDPNEWGPLKGTLPPVAERPARAARAGAAAGVDRPRRARSVGEGSASQAAPAAGTAADAPPVRADRPRRSRSVGEGSVSQATPETPEPPRRTARTQSSDAPWHAPVPAHEKSAERQPEAAQPGSVRPAAAKAEPAGPEAEKSGAVESEATNGEPAKVAPVAADAVESKAAQPEPARPAAVESEVAKAEPAVPGVEKSEGTQAGAAQPEPAESEATGPALAGAVPMAAEPAGAQAEPVPSGPAVSEAGESEGMRAGVAKPAGGPVEAERREPEPVKPEPVKPEPLKPEAAEAEPVKPEPVKPEPLKPEAAEAGGGGKTGVVEPGVVQGEPGEGGAVRRGESDSDQQSEQNGDSA